jgi:uncharacterized iron-regulated membrane protein
MSAPIVTELREAAADWGDCGMGNRLTRAADTIEALLGAALGVLDYWDDRRRGEQERYVPPRADNELPGYWSPCAAMVASEHIAALRAAIAKARS